MTGSGVCAICHRAARRLYGPRCGRCHMWHWRHRAEWTPADGVRRTLRQQPRPCQALGCARRSTRLTRGYCHKCYQHALRLFGDRWRAQEMAS